MRAASLPPRLPVQQVRRGRPGAGGGPSAIYLPWFLGSLRNMRTRLFGKLTLSEGVLTLECAPGLVPTRGAQASIGANGNEIDTTRPRGRHHRRGAGVLLADAGE